MCQSPRRVITQMSLRTEGRRDSGVPMSTGERDRRSSQRSFRLATWAASGGDAAAAPVRVRKTSSSVGWRTPRSSTASSASCSSTGERGRARRTPSRGRGGRRAASPGRRPRPAPVDALEQLAPTRPRSAGVRGRRRSSWSPPTWRLSVRASPRAITRPWSTTTISSREAVGLLEVLRGQEDRRALADERVEHVPQLVAGARVEAGGRLVEEQHRRARDERRRQVEPAAHAAGVVARQRGRRRRSSENCSSSSSARAHRGLAAEVVQLADHHEVLAAGEHAVDRRVLRRRGRCARRTWSASATTSKPATAREPASGRLSVVRTRTAVVLPAPFGPSRPQTVPAGTSRSTPCSACVSP